MGPTLAKNIPPSTNSFTSYLSQTQYFLRNQTFTSAELDSFPSEKTKRQVQIRQRLRLAQPERGLFWMVISVIGFHWDEKNFGSPANFGAFKIYRPINRPGGTEKKNSFLEKTVS